MAKITGAQCLAEMLQGYGVSHVFMVPAVLRRTFAEMERRTKIKRIHTHGEKSAAYMADGCARASGRPGICMAQVIGARGREFGTNTGRPRHCGWFDAMLVRQTVRTCGIHGLALTKLDILDGFDTIEVCTGYMLDGKEIDHLPAGEGAQARIKPVYETIEGWKEPTANARSWADLPAQAIKYVRRVEELVGCPIALLSTSPEREDTILVQNPFEA